MRPGRVVHALTLAAATASVSAAAASAQLGPEGAGVVHGRVVDSASGRGVADAWVCVRLRVDAAEPVPVCTAADSEGRYRLASLPAGPHPVTVACPSDGPADRTLATATVPLPDSAAVERDWRVSSRQCVRPARRLASGDFDGHYTAGFETSLFVPCPHDRWARPGRAGSDDPADPHLAWATPRDTAVFEAVDWPPDPPIDRSGAARYFVRWRGTVEGPGRYGHLGTATFRIAVDRVLEARVPGPGDCDAAGRGSGPGPT